MDRRVRMREFFSGRQEVCAVAVEDRVEDGAEEFDWISASSESHEEQLLQFQIDCAIGRVPNVPHQLRLDEGPLHGLGVEGVERDV